ncbi:unnamed protein product [Dovyalis caffra]|uniref:Uncharacterized protein n=1 Tax=Dovyalis caffra TaxID=77055 RepID=A0AAV1RX61_9ROSI|nr:unnamed protein product [Dovyalis caffra]
MKPIDDKKDAVVIRAVSRDEEGKKRVEKAEVKTHKVDTVKYIEKKLVDKGIIRMERHPVDGKGGIGKPPPKSGHGGKYTWEGPDDEAESELEGAAQPAIDEKDPNYVDEEAEEKLVRGEEKDVADLIAGEVEVAKAVEERDGVARVEFSMVQIIKYGMGAYGGGVFDVKEKFDVEEKLRGDLLSCIFNFSISVLGLLSSHQSSESFDSSSCRAFLPV